MSAGALEHWDQHYRPAATHQTATWQWDDADWVERDIPQRPWLVPGYLLRGAVTVLAAAPKLGKSTVVLGWASCLALGCQWPAGRFDATKCGPQTVVLCNVEDDLDEQKRRLSATLRQFGRTSSDIKGRILRGHPAGVGMLMEFDPATGSVNPTELMDALTAKLTELRDRDTPAGALFLDPMAELHSAPENDNQAIRAVVAYLRKIGFAEEFNLAVGLVHHFKKGGATAAPGDMDQIRGGGAIVGAARVNLTCHTMRPEEAQIFGVPSSMRRSHFRLDDAGSNYSPPGDAEWFRLTGYPLDNGEMIAAAVPWHPPSPLEGLSWTDMLSVLDQIVSGFPDGQKYSLQKQSKDRWAGNLLVVHGRTVQQAAAILKDWLNQEILVECASVNPKDRHKSEGVTVNLQKLDEMRSNAPSSPVGYADE